MSTLIHLLWNVLHIIPNQSSYLGRPYFKIASSSIVFVGGSSSVSTYSTQNRWEDFRKNFNTNCSLWSNSISPNDPLYRFTESKWASNPFKQSTWTDWPLRVNYLVKCFANSKILLILNKHWWSCSNRTLVMRMCLHLCTRLFFLFLFLYCSTQFEWWGGMWLSV